MARVRADALHTTMADTAVFGDEDESTHSLFPLGKELKSSPKGARFLPAYGEPDAERRFGFTGFGATVWWRLFSFWDLVRSR
jgi:hypothetical protein